MREKIKPIEGFPNYFVDSKGTVYTTTISPRYNPNGELRVLQPRNHPSGYLYVGFYTGKKGEKRKWRRVHRLVAENFIGEIPFGYEVDHKDGNRTNNDVSNLRIVTHRENVLLGFQRRNNGK